MVTPKGFSTLFVKFSRFRLHRKNNAANAGRRKTRPGLKKSFFVLTKFVLLFQLLCPALLSLERAAISLVSTLSRLPIKVILPNTIHNNPIRPKPIGLKRYRMFAKSLAAPTLF